MEFVTIGNPGNAADSNVWDWGAVAYTYSMGKYEISRDMVDKANTAGGLGITMANLSANGGNGANRPASGISWNEAARFVNWLNTSQGYQAAYKFITGGPNDNIVLWSAGDAGYQSGNPYRNSLALYVLPSIDEWHKAAFGSPSGTWYDFVNGGNSPPTAVSGGTSGAVVNLQAGPADIDNAGGLSPFGTMAQGGNVWELIENSYDQDNPSLATPTDDRFLRGGSWFSHIGNFDLAASDFNSQSPANDSSVLDGFRVAMVPEPSALSLLAVGLGGLAVTRRRKTK